MLNLVEDYRPKSIDECILPDRIKKVFKNWVEKNEIQNMLLQGPSGTGKTSVAKAFCEELDIDYLIINCPRDGNIEALRNQIGPFAERTSIIKGDRMKAVILDEADGLDPNKVQKSLNGMIEEFKDTCRFIFTCNYKNKILPAIHSRLVEVSFNITTDEAPLMMKEFAVKVFGILDKLKIEYDKKVVARFIKKNYPDMRKILNELQMYQTGGPIDSGILASDISESRVKELLKICSGKNNWENMCQWAADNQDLILGTQSNIFTAIAEHAHTSIVKNDLPHVILIVNKHSYRHAFVQDQLVNFKAMMTEIIGLVEFYE